ncbi:MAG: hypothetical protein GY861_24640 [bacterium]|nr:hypothetical protein [bacterium]
MANIPSGTQGTYVLDSNKFVCPNCNGTFFQISQTFDEEDDINSPNVTALTVTNAGTTDTLAVPVLCQSCGEEQASLVMMFDICAGAAAAAITMTNMVETSANSLAGWYAIYLDAAGTDTGLYYTIASNTAADPTVITLSVATNNDEVGYWLILNWLPVGWTAAS